MREQFDKHPDIHIVVIIHMAEPPEEKEESDVTKGTEKSARLTGVSKTLPYLLFPRFDKLVILHSHLAGQSLATVSRRAVGVDDMVSCMEERADLGQCTQYYLIPFISSHKSYRLTNAHHLRQRAIRRLCITLDTTWPGAQSKMFMGIIWLLSTDSNFQQPGMPALTRVMAFTSRLYSPIFFFSSSSSPSVKMYVCGNKEHKAVSSFFFAVVHHGINKDNTTGTGLV